MKNYFLFFFWIPLQALAQQPTDFTQEVAEIQQKYDTLWDASEDTMVFTGSSSIRLWKSLKSSFPDHQIVNTGFGGSEASDLLAYSEQLIHRFRPTKVFIYEGDNDINVNKKPKRVLNDLKKIIAGIQQRDPNTEVVLISVKPSIARWHLKKRYKRLNRKLKKLGKKDPLIYFANVWKPMMDKGKLKKDIFVEDGLHLNEKGYRIWTRVLQKYVEQ